MDAARRRPRVLVMEDEWIIAEQLEIALTEGGFEVIGPVGHIDAAIGLLEDGPIEAAVLDINLHDEPTFAFAARLAASDIPFVFVSGYSRVNLPAALRTRPLLPKPIDPVVLRQCLGALIAPTG